QQPEQSAAARSRTDRGTFRLVEAKCDEVREPVPALVEHAERRIARAGELARDAEQGARDLLEVRRRHDRPTCVDQRAEPCLVEAHCAQQSNGTMFLGIQFSAGAADISRWRAEPSARAPRRMPAQCTPT